MSLHLGNLSSRVRRDDLECVFRRFGRCNVQVKDRYGFVVYDYPAGAEKALKTLRGKNICGEPITLSWSNRQPRHEQTQRHVQGGRFYQPLRQRPPRENHVNQKLSSIGRRDHKRDLKAGDINDRKLGSNDQVDEGSNYHLNNTEDFAGEKCHTILDDNPDEGGGPGTKPIDDDRWGAHAGGSLMEDGLDFDRFDPLCGDNRKQENVTHTVASRKSEEKTSVEQVDQVSPNSPIEGKTQKTCFICREVGHRKHKCPRDLKQLASSFQGGLHSGSDGFLMRLHKCESESSRSRNCQNLMKHEDSPLPSVNHRSRRKNYAEKKRSRREHESAEKSHSKKSRGPSNHSDYIPSRSRSKSRSLRSLSNSSTHTRSKSIRSRENSPSNSRSGSKSLGSRSRSSKSHSFLRSNSPTALDLCETLGRPLPPSQSILHIDPEESLANYAGPYLEEALVGGGAVMSGDREADIAKHENVDIVKENENAAAPHEVQESANESSDDAHDHAMISSSCEVKDSYILKADIVNCPTRDSFKSCIVMDIQNNDLLTGDTLAPAMSSEVEVPGGLDADNSKSIDPKEIYRVLKYYGLGHPEEDENDLPVEDYFGAARLWPWEIVYYRRLKKGPISNKNYARRVAQNREFGIVDKYIRSSSGWGELSREKY